MLLLNQTWTLVKKNLLITCKRQVRSTVTAAFLLPIFLILFLSYSQDLLILPSTFGVGTPTPARTLSQGLNAATGGRDKVVFVNNGLSNGDIDAVIDNLVEQVSAAGKTPIRLEREIELRDVCRSTLWGATTCYGAVVFTSSPSEGRGGLWNYTLRADGAFGYKIDTMRTQNEVEIYLLPLQHAIDAAIVGLNPTIESLPMILEYPYTSMTQDERDTDIRVKYHGTIIDVLGVALLLGMINITYHLTGFIASERELGMSQLIEAMMPNIRRWEPQAARIFSYHLSFDCLYIPGWFIVGVILGMEVFVETSLGIVIVFHILTGLAMTSFAIFGASFFKKAQLSGIACFMVTLCLGILAQVLGSSEKHGSTLSSTILSVLFPSCNYIYFVIAMARFEKLELAMDLAKAAPEDLSPAPSVIYWLVFLIQITAYPILAAFVERSLYGTASVGRSVVQNIDAEETPVVETVTLQGFSKQYQPSWFRRKVAGITRAPALPVQAVTDLSISARKGQIYVLLGANGSGKSTTLEAIAGLNTVTSGSIIVDGTGGIGIAPQKNVLWEELTVGETIQIFNRLKSPRRYDDFPTIRALVEAVDLSPKMNARAKTLSGGQKRKLQLGLMFTGGSSVCCVDEVSSGLDPLSRRKIWDILLAERGARTIILTTHFLDEADLLADQIAILSKGTLRAQGSSVELKEVLGGGYRVHVATNPNSKPAPSVDNIPSQSTLGQTVYSPIDSKQAAHLIKLLDSQGLTNYQLFSPTIEDVFLRVADEVRAEYGRGSSHDLVSRRSKISDEKSMTAVSDRPRELLDLQSGQIIGLLRQSSVLFRKRLTILRRNYFPYMAAFLLPIIAAALVTLFVKDQELPTCATDESSKYYDWDTAASQQYQQPFHLVAGPAYRFANETLFSLYAPLIPPSLAKFIPTQNNISLLQTVDTFEEFNAYIRRNYKTVNPVGIWLGNTTSVPTVAYKADPGYFFTGQFGQNMMNVMLSNTSIGSQYSSFQVPWVAETGKSLQLVAYFAVAMAAYPAFFALYPTLERVRNIRGLEFSNGVRSLSLWLAYGTFDLIPVILSSAIIIGIFAVASSVWYHVGYLFIIFLLYGLASILFAYVVSLFAKTQLSAYACAAAIQVIMFLVYLIAYICTLTYAPVNLIDSSLLVVHFLVSALSPMGSLVRSLFLALNLFSATCEEKQLASNPVGIFQYGGPILYLSLQIVILFCILLWYDSGAPPRHRSKKQPVSELDGESLVTEDEIELTQVSSVNDGLQVLNLTKSFGKLTAVENMTFGIERGEVFALLGPSGAGKSTTISLIRGDLQPSKNGGKIFVENVDISRQRTKARSHLGVCPQYDAMDQMTVIEHLRFYARVRGVPGVEHNVQEVIKAVGLEAFSSRMAATLSGGNKRKLSLGIALIGNPAVLLLDEPSSGMDAASKRVMWKTLAAVVPGRSLLLTTHSMEEADALADRVGIMARKMLAMGSIDHLRRDHGHAYYVHLVMKSAPYTTDKEIDALKTWVSTRFRDANIEEKTYHGQIRFSIPVRGKNPELSEHLPSNPENPFDDMYAENKPYPRHIQFSVPAQDDAISKNTDFAPEHSQSPATDEKPAPADDESKGRDDDLCKDNQSEHRDNGGIDDDEKKEENADTSDGSNRKSRISEAKSHYTDALTTQEDESNEEGESISADTEIGASDIITLLEENRERFGLEHYSVTPTTLDQVFLSIVQKHNVEEEGYVQEKESKRWKRVFGR